MNTPYLYQYRNGEFIQYLLDVLDFLEPLDVQALQLAEQQSALAAVVAKLEAAYKEPLNSQFTPELAALDERRDTAYRGLKGAAENALRHFNPGIATAAKLLQRNLTAHGDNVPGLGYTEETTVLRSLVQDWETQAELKAAVTTVNLGDWLQELKTTNEAFAKLYRDRVTQESQNPTPSVSSFRGEATEAYRTLVTHISAHATLNTNPAHTELLNQIDTLAGKYNQTINIRAGSNAANNPEPPTEPGTPSSS